MGYSIYQSKMKLLIWCMGCMGKAFSDFAKDYVADSIIGYTDSNAEKTESKRNFCGHPIYSTEEVCKLEFDCIVIASSQKKVICEVKEYIKEKIKVDCTILTSEQAMNIIRRKRVIEKYEKTEDLEIKKTVEWLREHEISVRNQRENQEKTYYEVYFDKEKGDFPYVDFYGKRMYYPRDYEFERDGDKYFLTNVVECDQYPGSPHLYIEGTHRIYQNDVIVDAGVAEGNFALTYIDMVSKAYLIESDQRWLDALELTFKPYRKKVVFIPKNLSDENTKTSTTLDSIIQSSRVDFVKMDIEGAETKALLGGINVLRNCAPRLSVCTYHRERDMEYIIFLLESLEYEVRPAEGYMFFLYDPNIDNTLDFRRGIVRAVKIDKE